MPRPGFDTVDQYLAAQLPATRRALERVRATIKKALPRATEGISYQIPIYKIDGAMVLYFAGYAHHYSIYPATAKLLRTLEKELAPHLEHKATLRFALDERVPIRLIARIAKIRAAEAAERRKARAGKKTSTKKQPPSRQSPTRKRAAKKR